MKRFIGESSDESSQRTDSNNYGIDESHVTSSRFARSTTLKRPMHDTKNPSSPEGIETLRVVDGLEADISGGDYISFLKQLDDRGTGGTSTSWDMEENVLIEGFRLLRFYVIKSQISNPNVVVLTGEGWLKTIKSKLNAFKTSKKVVVGGLLTLVALSSLPGNYKNLIMRREGIEYAMKMLDYHNDDKNICSLACALLLSLSLNEKEGLNATYVEIETLIRRLVSSISRGGHESDVALRILFQFTCQKKKLPNTTKSLSYLLKNLFREEENSVLALLNVIKNQSSRESSVEASISLLWRLSVPKDEFDNEYACLTSTDTIETMISAMSSFDSVTIREAGCGILANISIRIDLSVELAQKSFSLMQEILSRNEKVDEGVATCALHAICNILEKHKTRTSFLLDQKMIELVISMMERNPECEELIEFACLVIGRASRNDQGVKEMFVSLGVFDLLIGAFEKFVTTRLEDPSLDVKDASLCAFGTLTGCRSGALAAISTGMIDIFTTLLAVETDRDFAVILDVIVANTRNCSTKDTSSMSPEDMLRNGPRRFSELIQSAVYASDVSSLIQVMLDIHRNSLQTAFCLNESFAVFLAVMIQWNNSATVQEKGSLLLAEIYFHIPYPIDAMETVQGPWAAQNQQVALNVIHRAMDSYDGKEEIQRNGCLAILNLLHPISETGRESLDRQIISPVIELSYEAILKCMRQLGSNVNIQKCGISALSVSISVAQTQDFKPWANRIARQLSNVLLRFSDDYSVQALALNALIIIQETHPTIILEYGSTDINILLTLVNCEDKEVSGRSSAILSSHLRSSPKSCIHIIECHDYIEKIMSSVRSSGGDLQIKLNTYSIFRQLVAVNVDRCAAITALLDQQNGIQTLCMGVTSHPQSREMTITLCKILASIMPYLGANGMSSSREAIKFFLIDGLENQVENPEVVSAIFDTFCICCGREDYFKEFLLEETRARMIINTMQFCLGSDCLQSNGCKLISLLSNFGNGKETIGRCGGIQVIVNALLAHNDSAKVQKEGLIALKNLATAPQNKPMIAETGAGSTVVYALWIHFRDPEVISLGLSALNNIAVDSISRSVAKMEDQVLTIVISAMKSFSMDELVQKNACFYLKTCSYLPENVRVMSERSDILLPLLFQAAENFPQACSDRSAAVVTKITS